MSIYVRLCKRNNSGIPDENIGGISIDQFSAMLIEYTFGAVTREQVISEFNLDATEQVQLDYILSKGANASARRELYQRIRSILHLAEGNVAGYGLPSQLEAVIQSI